MNDILDPNTLWEDNDAQPKLLDFASIRDISTLTGTPQVALVYNDTTQTIVTGVALLVPFDSEHFDTNDFHDNVSNNSRLTVTEAGYYRIYMDLQINAGANGDSLTYKLFKNGNPLHEMRRQFDPVTAELSNIGFDVVDLSAVDDFYEIELAQGSGSNWSILQDTDLGFFGIEKLNGTT